MIKLDGVELYIDAPKNGVIMMDIDGAVGKTYAASLLNSYAQKYPGDALVLTYDTHKSTDAYVQIISDFHGTYLFLDRYDLYKDDRITELLNTMDCYRFVDSKDCRFWNKTFPILCETILEKDKVTIKEI